MVTLLALLGCTTPLAREEVARPSGRAVVQSCPAPRRPIVGQAPAPAIPDAALNRLSHLGAPGTQPLDLTLVVDRSGSMAEEGRMVFVKRAAARIAEGLRPGDRLNLVVFDNEPCTSVSDWVAGRDAPGVAIDGIASVAPRGSTDLAAGLHAGYLAATQTAWRGDESRDRRLVLITDALVGEDDLDDLAANEVLRAWQVHHIALHTVGVGQEPHAPLLARLAELGGGTYAYLGASAWVTSRREQTPEPDPR